MATSFVSNGMVKTTAWALFDPYPETLEASNLECFLWRRIEYRAVGRGRRIIGNTV